MLLYCLLLLLSLLFNFFELLSNIVFEVFGRARVCEMILACVEPQAELFFVYFSIFAC